MNKSLGGIKDMRGLPGALFIVDPKREYIATREAVKLHIPVVALCDTNCDPDGINYVIPGNDDAIKSIQLFTTAIADACLQGASMSRDGTPVVAPEVDERVEVVRRGTAEEAEEDDRDKAEEDA
jgi:small subunit ribosomal protein S2